MGRQAWVSLECAPGDSNRLVPTPVSLSQGSDLQGHIASLQEAPVRSQVPGADGEGPAVLGI